MFYKNKQNKKLKIVETVEDEGTFQAKDSDVTVVHHQILLLYLLTEYKSLSIMVYLF